MALVDKSLHFGIQNFFYCDDFVGSDVSGDTNEYVAFMDKKGLIFIARYDVAGLQGRYYVAKGDYDTIVAARGEYSYLLPSQLAEVNL